MTRAPCRLTIQDGERTPRLYWRIGAELFRPNVLALPGRPCPFKGGSYQLMRNICFASAFATRAAMRSFAFIVCYVGGAKSARRTKVEVQEFKAMLRPELHPSFGAVSYEQIAEIAGMHGDEALATWISCRLQDGLARA
jgi:hypothetical protein